MLDLKNNRSALGSQSGLFDLRRMQFEKFYSAVGQFFQSEILMSMLLHSKIRSQLFQN